MREKQKNLEDGKKKRWKLQVKKRVKKKAKMTEERKIIRKNSTKRKIEIELLKN